MVGRTVSHYRVLARLGGGGMGVVYKAEDTRLKRLVALKFLPPEYSKDAHALERFQREAQTASALNHPHICTIFDIDEADGQRFIAMELLEGQTLRERLEGRPMPTAEVVALGLQLADALHAAHLKGIVHRDIKPGNVFLTSPGTAKLLDFGLAKLLAEPHAASPNAPTAAAEWVTSAGVTLGTVGYMSPEQVRGEVVDARTDLFSLGVVLYEMATGTAPFRGTTSGAVLGEILTKVPTAPVRLNPEVPADLERIVAKLLEKDRELRYQSAKELRVDLERLRRADAKSTTAQAEDDAALEVQIAGPRRKLVILPFENLGPAEDEYFASGMTEEITSRLAVVGGLGVISRTTAMQYDARRKSIKQIGDELGVDFVLEGTVRWARGAGGTHRVRITPQLIRVSDDTHIWADRYDRVMDDVFQVQSEIAEHVTEQLGVVLLARELQEVRDRPTKNFEAYQAYLRGLYYERPRGFLEERDRLAVQMLQEAVELDPAFALAHAELAITHSALYHYGFDHSSQRLDMATKAIEQAARLSPDSPRVRLAMGYYHYWCRRDYERAFAELTAALRGMPGNSEVLAVMGFVRRRQGRWEAALGHFKKACELNPIDTHFAIQLGDTLAILGRHEEAEPYYDKSIRFLPDQVAAYVAKANLHWKADGNVAKARSVLEAMPETARNSSFGFIHWFWQEIFEGKYREALDRLSHTSEEVVNAATRWLLAAQAWSLLDDRARSREAFEAARVLIEDQSREDPENYWLHAALGIVFAGLDRKEEAIREATRATELCPVATDPLDAGVFVKNLALVHTITGDLNAATGLLENLFASGRGVASVENLQLFPSTFSLPMLRLDPRWRPLWNHPRFQALARSVESRDLPMSGPGTGSPPTMQLRAPNQH